MGSPSSEAKSGALRHRRDLPERELREGLLGVSVMRVRRDEEMPALGRHLLCDSRSLALLRRCARLRVRVRWRDAATQSSCTSPSADGSWAPSSKPPGSPRHWAWRLAARRRLGLRHLRQLCLALHRLLRHRSRRRRDRKRVPPPCDRPTLARAQCGALTEPVPSQAAPENHDRLRGSATIPPA